MKNKLLNNVKISEQTYNILKNLGRVRSYAQINIVFSLSDNFGIRPPGRG